MGERRLALAGRVVVVGVSEPDAAHALAAAGAAIVVVGSDAAAVGALVAALEPHGGRVAGFVGNPAHAGRADALAEMLAELFPATA